MQQDANEGLMKRCLCVPLPTLLISRSVLGFICSFFEVQLYQQSLVCCEEASAEMTERQGLVWWCRLTLECMFCYLPAVNMALHGHKNSQKMTVHIIFCPSATQPEIKLCLLPLPNEKPEQKQECEN